MYKRLLLAIIITSFIGPFAGSGLSVAIPAIGREFVTTAEMLSYVVFAFLLGSAMFVLPIGRVADIYGRRKIYTIGLWLFAGTFLLAGIAPNIESLVAMRFLQGAVYRKEGGAGEGYWLFSSCYLQRPFYGASYLWLSLRAFRLAQYFLFNRCGGLP